MYTKDAGLRQCVILEMKTNAQSMVKGYRSTAPSPQDDELSHYVYMGHYIHAFANAMDFLYLLSIFQENLVWVDNYHSPIKPTR